jgi:hypothetical protein
VLLAACGSERPTTGVPLADYCAQFSEAVCESVARCGCDTTDCATRAAARCPLREGFSLRVTLEGGRIPYDDLGASRFIDRARAVACDERATECGSSDDCYALSDAGGQCGTNHGCVTGLVCIGGTCAEPAGDGSACMGSEQCASGLCSGGVCMPAAAVGAPCTVDSECTTGRCDFTSERCREPEPDDALCVRHEECASGYCDRDSTISAGNCRARLTAGEACDDAAMCLEGGCAGSVCVPAACLDAM